MGNSLLAKQFLAVRTKLALRGHMPVSTQTGQLPGTVEGLLSGGEPTFPKGRR
ncbi:MAG: hypothetical protein ACFCVA_13265 [Gammaproteobacteria bacterium]